MNQINKPREWLVTNSPADHASYLFQVTPHLRLPSNWTSAQRERFLAGYDKEQTNAQ